MTITVDIYTVGHSTHSVETFITMLKAYNIQTLVDVRSYAGSRHVPQYNKENMIQWLGQYNIEYVHLAELGGRRRKLKYIDETLINGWTYVSFRNYAAYTLTDEYEQGIQKLLKIAQGKNVCYFCSEVLPWKCHRSIVSNTLTAMGLSVYHIMSEDKIDKHELGKYGAKPIINNHQITYPKSDVKQLEFQLE